MPDFFPVWLDIAEAVNYYSSTEDVLNNFIANGKLPPLGQESIVVSGETRKGVTPRHVPTNKGGGWVIALALAVGMTGCAAPYMVDRGRDAADIFTATVGGGVGAKIRAGPIEVGLIIQGDIHGLRGGTWIHGEPDKYDPIPPIGDIQFLIGGIESFLLDGSKQDARNKSFQSEVVGPFGGIATGSPNPPYYFTQLDIVVGFGPSVRLGFNPGELLDFLLGWFGIDIYSDDLEAKKQRQKIELKPDGESQELAP